MNLDVLDLFRNYMIRKRHIYLRVPLLKDGVWLKFLGLFLGSLFFGNRFFCEQCSFGIGSFSDKSSKGGKNLKVEELEKELKSEKLSSLYLLYGEEKFLLENSLKKIKSLFGECLKGINYITIDDTNLRRNNFRFRNSKFWI